MFKKTICGLAICPFIQSLETEKCVTRSCIDELQKKRTSEIYDESKPKSASHISDQPESDGAIPPTRILPALSSLFKLYEVSNIALLQT